MRRDLFRQFCKGAHRRRQNHEIRVSHGICRIIMQTVREPDARGRIQGFAATGKARDMRGKPGAPHGARHRGANQPNPEQRDFAEQRL